MWFSLMLCLILPLTLARPKAALFVLVFLLAFMSVVIYLDILKL